MLLACPACGSGWTWPPPDRDAVSDDIWIASYGATRLRRRDTWVSEARLRLDWLAGFVEPGAVILEVGSGTGEFVKVAGDLGYDAYGIEPSAWAAEQSRKFGARVDTGFLSEWPAIRPGVRPSLVALWHTLEHVPDPVDLMKEVREVLGSGGRVAVEVPNFSSSAAERLGTAWEGAEPDEHHFQFTPEGLTAVLEQAGFSEVDVIPLSAEIYARPEEWERRRQEAEVHGWPWPSLDLMRATGLA